MKKAELLDRIEWLLQYKDEGEHLGYSFTDEPGNISISQETYNRCLKKNTLKFFLAHPKNIKHQLYEIYLSSDRGITVTTISYILYGIDLTIQELQQIYQIMKPNCTHNGKPIYK